MNDWSHQFLQANGIRIHYVRQGAGAPLVLLHGWPEFWLTWRKNIGPLSENFDVIVPDLRGFGETDKPDLPAWQGYSLEMLVEDLRGLLDGLGIDRCGIVSHDVGAFVAQAFARTYPERATGLFFFNCPYPGIGSRWLEPDHLKEIWYQSFHQLPVATAVVGRSRQTCETYFRHFLSHWPHRADAFDDDFEAWVDNFMRPGNLQGGFNWYIAINDVRLDVMRHGPPALPKIEIPTCVRWGVSDKVMKVEWADGLDDYFADIDFKPVPEAGHFVQYERPDYANREIASFFAGLADRPV